MGLARQIRRLRKAKEAPFGGKTRKALIEPLEPRILLDADLSFAMTGSAYDLTLRLDEISGVESLVLINNLDSDPGTQIVATRALTETSSVEIIGTDQDDFFRLAFDFEALLDSLSIFFMGGEGSDTLDFSSITTDLSLAIQGVGDVTVTDGEYTVHDDGSVSTAGGISTLTAMGIENILGGQGANTFVFEDGATLAGTIDGGRGGKSTLDYSAYSTLNPVGVNLFTGEATGTAGINHIQNVIGGSGDDVLIGNDENNIFYGGPGNDTLRTLGGNDILAGGEGEDTLIGPEVDSLWEITGLNEGLLNKKAEFSGIEHLIGAANNQDGFIFFAEGSISGSITGGDGGSDGLIVEDPAEDGPFTVVNPDPSGTGSLTLYGKTIAYAGMEPLVDTSAVDTVVIHGSVYDDILVLEDAVEAGAMQIRSLSGDFFDAATAALLNALVFANPMTSLTITLGAGEDSLTLGALDPSFSAAITYHGGAGFDTLLGSNGTNTWAITGENQGLLNGFVSFSAVENLVGGSGQDDFIFADGASVTGLINGGGGGPNTLNYAANTSGVTVALGIDIDNIDVVIGGSGEDTLFGLPDQTTWIITSMGGGRLVTTETEGTVIAELVFMGFENLAGRIGDDTFLFDDGMGVTGFIDGGGGNNILDYSAFTAANSVTVNLGSGAATGASSVGNIHSVIGGAGNDTLFGPDGDTLWNITGADSGDVADIFFTGFENLVGAPDNEDGFIFHIGGSLSGTVDGGAGGFDGIAAEDPSDPGTLTPFEPNPAGAGIDSLYGKTITYSGMEPIFFIDTLDPDTATIRTFFLPEQVTLAQGTTETQLRLEVQIGPSQFNQVFDIPTQSLTIDLGGGNDTLTIGQINMLGCGLTLLGGRGDDSVVFSGDVMTRGGKLSVAAETLTVSPGVVLSTRNAQGDQEIALSEGDSGDLLLAGKTIIIGSGAKLFAFDNRPSEADPRGIPSAIGNQAWSGDEKPWALGKRYTNLATTSSGSGTDLTVNVYTDDEGLPTVRLNTRGTGYAIGDTITITDTEDKIGGPVTVEISGLMLKGGDILLTATDHKLAVDNSTAEAGIEITGATLWGRDVIIKADADNDVIFDGEKNTAEKIGESVLDALLNLRPLVGVSRVGSVADILINTGTLIRADGDVTLDAHANSEANVITLGLGASVAYARSEADATVTVASGAEISAVGSVSLGSAADNVVSVSAKNSMSKTPEMLGEKLGGIAIPTHITVTVTEAYSHATTTVAGGAFITAGEDVDVLAYNTKNLKSIASSGGNADYFGAAVVVALSEATAEAAVHGTVTAVKGDVSVIAKTDSIKNITNAQSIHGDSKFAKATSYLSEITPFKLLKDAGVPLAKGAMAGVSSLIDAVKLKVKGRPRSNAVVERPQEDKTTEKIRKFGGSVAVAVGVHENSATARIGSTAVVKAGGDVEVRADAVERPDITAVSIVSSGTDKQKKEKERDKWEETEVSQPEYAGSMAVLVGDYTNTSHAAIDSGAVVDAGGSILIRSKTDVPYYPIWEQIKNLYVKSEAGIRDIVASVMFADIGVNSFVTSWALSAAEGKKAGIAGSVNLFMVDNTSTALIGDGALINQSGNAPGDVTVKATTGFEAVNLAGHYPGILDKVQIDKKEGLKDEKAGGQESEGDTGGIGGSYAGLYLNNTTRAAIESGAKVNADNLAVDAQTITKNITLGLAGGEAATYVVGGVVTLVDIADSTLAKIDDGAIIHAKRNIDVTALDDAMNLNFAGGVMQGRSLGFGITAGINLIDRDTRAIIGNQESVLGRGEFAPNTGVNGVENTIDLGYDHGFAAGQQVVYSNGGGGSIGGLVDGDAYYVKVVNAKTVNLARSLEEANEDPAIFFSADDVDDTEDVETIDLGYNHGYQTGDAVIYRNGGGESIGGLNDGQTYFIIRVSDTQVQLAALPDDALAETPFPVDLDLSLGGSGEAHSFRLDLEPSAGSGSSHSLGIGFDPTTAVNSSEASIDLGYEHGFLTGQRVVYSNGGGQSIDGLENKGIYYAVVVDPYTIRLAESPWQAHDGLFIALDGSTAEGISHTIGAGFTPIPFVDGNSDTIRFEGAHGFMEGQAVVYDSGSGADIGGLTSGETYYVKRIDAHTIKLAGTAGGEALDLDPAAATGTGHRLFEPTDVNGSVSSEGKTTLSATNDGLIVTVTLAASKTGDKASSKEEKGGKEAPSGGGKYGTALSGSVSVNSVSDITKAYIADSVITGAGDLEVKALETTQVISVSGAGALSTNQKGTFGLAGAVTVNVIDNDSGAYIHNSILEDIGTFTLHSEAKGRIVGVAAGLSGATRGIGIAGSVSVNVIDSDTGAYVDAGSVIKGATDVLITAKDTASIVAVAGAIAYGGKAGVGAGVAVNTIDTSSKACVADSDVHTSGTLALSAESDSDILAIAAAIGASKGTMAAAVSVSVNLVSNDTQASLLGTKTDDGISADSGVSLTAMDTSDIKVYAGGLALAFGKSVGDDKKKESKSTALTFGIAIAVNDIGNDVHALIDDSTVLSGRNVELTATSLSTIDALTIGGAVAVGASGQKTGFAFAGAGAGSGNTIRNTIEAAIKNGSTVTTTGTGAVMVTAMDASAIIADAGGVGIAVGASGQKTGAALSIGVSVADNLIENKTKAYIEGSAVTAAGNIELSAVSTAKIDALTIAGAVGVGASATKGGYAGAGAGAASYNDVKNTVEAYIKNVESVESTGGSLKVTAIDGFFLFAAPDLQAGDYQDDGLLPVAWREAFTENEISLSDDVTLIVRAEGREWLFKDNDNGETYLIKKEQDTFRVLKPTVITADGGGVAIAVGASGKETGGALSIGVSLADNTIANTIRAFIDNSGLANPGATSVSAAGDITLSAASLARIDSLTIGGAIAVGASGGGSGYAGAAAGAASYNRIENTIASFIKGVGAITSADGDLTLTATDSAAIIADAVGGSIAVGAGGASTGGALSIGISIAHNTISNKTLAYIDNSGLSTPDNAIVLNAGNVGLSAVSMNTIDALSIAASIAVGAGGKTGLALSGGGSESTNVILTQTNSYILGTDLVSMGDVVLDARNTSDITAKVFTGSVSVGAGGQTGVAASVGASLAQNLIGWDKDGNSVPADVQAYVKNSSITAEGDLIQTAVAEETIEAVVAAGSAAISAAGTTGVGLSGAGADATNKISTRVKAFIEGDESAGEMAIVADGITLTALDTSMITADVGAGSLAASFAGTTAVSISIGVSLAENIIANQVEAYILNVDSLVATDGAVALTAEESATVDALSVAASLAASFGNVGVALSGAGATVNNAITNTVKAGIAESAVTTSPSAFDDIQNDIIVDALSASSITALVGAASAAVSGGQVAASGSIGVALLDNLILNQVTACIQDSTIYSADDILVQAKAVDTIDVVAFSGSVAIAAGIGGAAAGCGVEVTNTLTSGVSAYLLDTVAVADDDIDVKAISDSHIVKSQAIGVAVAASLGSASVAVSLVDNHIGNTVQAYVAGSDGMNVEAGGNISVLADVERARMSDVGAVTASVTAGAVGLSGGGIDIENTIANTVNAYISGPFSVTADGDVSVVASEDAYIVGDATAVSVSVSLGAGLGVALVENQIGSTIQAWVSEATVTSSNTLIHADCVADVAKTISCGVSGSALLGAQGNEATAVINTLVKTYADDATLNSSGDVSILATAMNRANTNAKGGAFGAIAVGAMVSDVNLGRGYGVYEVEAAVGSGTKVYARTLRITAVSEDDLLAESTAGGGGAVAAAGAESDVTSTQATLARIGAGARIEVGGLVMSSLHTQDVDTSADSFAFAAAAGSGAGVSNTVTTRANVDIGAGAVVNAGNILINAKNQITKDDYKDSSNLYSGSASLGNVTVLLSETEIGTTGNPFEAVVTIGDGARLTVTGDNQNPGMFKIEALNKIAAFDSVRIESVSGFGISTGISRVESDTLAAINVNGAILESKAGDVYLTAKTDSTVSTSANLFVATALTGGAGAEATTNTQAANQINVNGGALKGSDVYLYAGKDSFEVPNVIFSFANVELTALSMLPNIAVPIPTVDIRETNTVNVLNGSSIQALEDVNLAAQEGIGGKDRRMTDGLALSLSLIPYGFPIPGYGKLISTNRVNIDTTARIEAGINNQAILLIKPVTLMGEQNIDPARLEAVAADRILTQEDKIKEAISYVFVTDKDVVKAVAGANKGGEVGNRYRYIGENAELVLSEQDYSDTDLWQDVTGSTTDGDVTHSSDYVTEVEYEYCALNAEQIAFTVYTGTVVQVVDDGEGNPAAGDGEIDAFYRYRIESNDAARIVLHQEDFTDPSRWEKLVIAYDLQILGQGEVPLQKGQIVRTADNELYRYLGENVAAIDLHGEDYGDSEKWGQLGPNIYRSDVTLSFQETLKNKFYVIKPTRVEAPTLSLQNVGAILLAQRREILDWIANHSSNPEAVARYQIALALVEETLAELGLIDIVEDQSGEMVKVANEGLDVLFVEVPDIYASPGSIFIRADAVSRELFEPLVDNQLVARAGAKISVFNETPFTMTVSDLVIRDTRRVAVVDGEYTVLAPGNVYFNNKGLTTFQDPGPKNVSVTQDSLSRNPADFDLELEIPEKIGQDLYVLGQVVNEVGDVTLINNEGSINVSGEIRAKNVIIRAAADFNLDTEDWFHILDPRQYPGLDALRKLVFNEAGTLKTKTYDENPFEVDPWGGAVLAQGRVAVTARYLNINGLIQSGVQTITLYVDQSFAPTETTSFLDKDGRPIAGISFGADRVPVDGYFDAQKGAIVVNEIIPKGGTIDLAGQILSTGSGMLRVAHGYSDVDIRNDSSYDLILNRIDTTIMRVGRITITDTARLQKVIYEMDGEQVKETVFQGTLSEVPGSGGSRIVYEEAGSERYDLSGDGSLIDTETGETVQYEPREGLYYVWTEGQEKTTVMVTYYKKRFFNLLGFDWDALAKDQNYEWRTIEYRDAYPLLESEVLALEPNYVAEPSSTVTIQTGQTVKTYDESEKIYKVYLYQGPAAEIDLSAADFTDASKWVRVVETPSYAEDKAYTVQYELRKDTDVELYQNISIIKVVADDNGVPYAKDGVLGGDVGHLYLYKGQNAELVLREQNYKDPDYWDDVTGDPLYSEYDYESDFLNYSFEYRTWTTGGGWLRYKTIHMLTTQTEGEKDYYTHTLKADYPIGLQFLQGPAEPSISIESKGDLYLQGTITAPAQGSVSLVSTAGSVLFGDEAAVLGASPVIRAAGSVRINVEGGNVPSLDSGLRPLSNGDDPEGVTIISDRDIEIRVVFDPDGNQSSTLVVGRVISTGGNVILQAGEGIQAFDLSSLVSGNRVELYTSGGSIGTAGLPLMVDSDILGSGGVAAWAYGDIYLRETSGDLKLGRPQSWEDVEASIYSETGNVVLEAVDGAILDAFYEEFRPRTQEEAEALDRKLQLTGEQAQAAAEASIRAEENTQTQRYHTYWETYRDAKPGEVQSELVIEVIDAGQDLITFSQAHGLQTGDQVFFSVGVDLGREDYSDASRWAVVVPDYDLQTVTGPVDLETEQVVRTADGALYQYMGEGERGVDLTDEDFGDVGRWARLVPDYDLATLETGVRTMIQTEQIVRTSDGAFYRYLGESVFMPYSNLENGLAYYAVIMDDVTIRLALSRYDAAISETPVVLDIKIEGSDDVVLFNDQGDFSQVFMIEFAYTYGDLNQDFSDLDDRYQTVHQTYGNDEYDPNFIYRFSEQERQERIGNRTLASGALRYQISQSLFSFLYPDAEGGGTEAPAEMPNVLANHVTLKAAGQVGRVTGTVVIDLSVGFENLPVEHQEILTYAGVDDVVSVVYDPDDPNRILSLTLQVWNDVNVEASSAVTVTAGGGIALEAEGDLLVDSIQAGGAVRLVARGNILDNYTEGSGAAISTSGDLTLVSETESIGSEDQWVRIDLQDGALLTARAAGSVYVEGQAGALHVDQVEATSGDVWLMVRDSLSAGDDLVIEGEGSVKAAGSVSLLAGDSLRMETGSRVEAGAGVLIHGDYGNADPGVGCVLDIGGGIFGASIEVRGDGDDDVINVSVLPEGMAMTIVAGGGENTINVGRLSTWTSGLVDGIGGLLRVMSEGGLDTLNIDDTGDETDNVGFLRGTSLSGLGMGSGEIVFMGVEVVKVFLGSGDDLFFVEEATEESVIHVNLGPGDDGIEFFDGQFVTGMVDGGEGTDTIDYHRWSRGVEVDLLRGAATGVYLGREGGVKGFENAVGGAGDDLLIGDHGPNLLVGNDGDDRLFGNGGDDVLIGGRGDDYLEGGEGNDRYVFAGGNLGRDTIFEAGDGDRLGRVNDPHDLLDFSDFPGPVEISLGRTSAQVVGVGAAWEGHELVLRLLSATGIEDVIGSAYDDRIIGNARNNTLWGGEGNDWLYGGAGDDVLYGGPGNDRLYGNRGDDLLAGGGGDDWIDGGAGTDLLFFPGAEEGVEVVLKDGGYGWSTDGLGGRDTLLGGIDGAIGTDFDDVLVGDSRPNVFHLGKGNNVVETGAGNDTVMWSKGGGENLIDLGPGWNRVVITLDDEEDLVSLTSGEKGLVEFAGSDGLSNGWMLPVTGAKVVEMHTLGGDDEVVIGDLKAAGVYEVLLFLGDGDDRVEGSDATARIRAYGERGNDYFVGGWGQDYFDGGDGVNWVDYSSAPGPVQVHMGGWAYRDGRGSWDYLQNIQNLIGTEFDDVIWGTEEDNVIVALGGNDRVWGMGGDDALYGGEGDDWLYGGAGDDVLYGGPGDDRLHGNTGNDKLYGGPGKDTLLGGRGNNLLVPNEEASSPLGSNPGSLVKMEMEPEVGKDETPLSASAEANRNGWLLELLVESAKGRHNPFEPRGLLQITLEDKEEEKPKDAS